MNEQTRRLIKHARGEKMFEDFVELAQHMADEGDSARRIVANMAERIHEEHYDEVAHLSDYLIEVMEEQFATIDWKAYAEAVVDAVDFPAPLRGTREWHRMRADMMRDAMKEGA